VKKINFLFVFLFFIIELQGQLMMPAYQGSLYNPVSKPTVSVTTVVTSINATTAISGGMISDDGGASVTARGVVWSTSTGPDISLATKTSDGTGTGTFISNIFGLLKGTSYYVRAYATNNAGTSYGNEILFTSSTTQGGSLVSIGDPYQGGIVIYILASGESLNIGQASQIDYDPAIQHGLIAANETVFSGTTIFGPDGSLANVTALGYGLVNTLDIISLDPTSDNAATRARNYTGGGYTDWYLPSMDELKKLGNNEVKVTGNTSWQTYYWSSSDNGNPWQQAYFL
jgi:hypothetical protein